MRPTRALRVGIAVFFILLVLLMGIGTYAVLESLDLDRDQQCRAQQSSDFNEEAWREMALLLVTAFEQDRATSREHASNLANLTPIIDRIEANCPD